MKLITRTISERRYTVRCMDINTCEVTDEEYSIGSMKFKTAEQALKALQSKYNTYAHKLVAIISTHSVDALYAMTEEAFIKAAIPVADVNTSRRILTM